MLGNLVVLLTSVTLSAGIEEEEVMAVEYSEIIFEEEEEEELAINTFKELEIETHSAFNEAQEFIENQESNRNELAQPTDLSSSLLQEASAVAQESIEPEFESQDIALNDAKERLEALKAALNSNAIPAPKSKGSNRKTTISYNLNNRKAVALPNPVYTCDSGGKIVINVRVNNAGIVKKTTYNEAASNTTNGCLIDSALEYAQNARFSSASAANQIGTITYIFVAKN